MALQANVVYYNNSSTAILAANATFTGVFENVLQYQEVSILAVSDVTGTLFLDVSNDGVTVLSTFSFPSSVSSSFRAPISTPFVRVRYTNGGTNQTTFAVTTIYRLAAAGTIFVPMSSNVFDASSGANSRTILFGKNAGGTYVMVPTDVDTGLRVTSSLGTTVGKTNVLKTGTITTTTTTADQVVLTYTVTAGKTFYLEYITFAHRLSALSGNNNPTLLGTISLETPSGTKVHTYDAIHPNYIIPGPVIGEPIPIAAGTVIRVVCTPAATASTIWRANFGGYEK